MSQYGGAHLSLFFLRLPRWPEPDITELQATCDKVIEWAMANLEEAGYIRNFLEVVGASDI